MYDLEQFVNEWRRAEAAKTLQGEELRAETARARRTANRGARRLEKLVASMASLQKNTEPVKALHTEMHKMNRRLTALVLCIGVAALAHPILASPIGEAMISKFIKLVMP